jgi:magnesium transporter
VLEIAGEHVTTRVPVVEPTARAGEIRRSLIGRTFESASHIAVCREAEEFLGLVPIEVVLAAADETPAEALLGSPSPRVAPGVDQEVAARAALAHRESALAVVDAQGRFQGLIPPHRLLAVLLHEHEEDLARVGGYLRQRANALHATEEPVPRRFWHRLPWLLAGLAGALLAADVVAAFEAGLHARVALAFFLPGIVYLADAVGTQTETIVVRGLSLGVAPRRIAGRELASGAAIGLALAAVSFPLLWWRWGEVDLVAGVALSIFAACSTATLVATTLPWALDRAGIDPAFGSGPLATLVQDLLSLAIYFAIASAMVL